MTQPPTRPGHAVAAVCAVVIGVTLVALALIPSNTARPPAPPVLCIARMVPGVEYDTAQLCDAIRPAPFLPAVQHRPHQPEE